MTNKYASLTFKMTTVMASLIWSAIGSQGIAGEADVVKVVSKNNGGNWSFNVTLQHEDEGWDHYADRWDVLTVDGQVLASRVLAHPHVEEQPFTRSLSGVVIPEGIKEVIIQGHDSVHGTGGKEIRHRLEN